MLAKAILLITGAQAVLQSAMLEQSASAAQLQMQAENLQAMWLDYKSSEQELRTEHEGFASSLLEVGNRMSTTHQQELVAKRNSAKVLEAMSFSLEFMSAEASHNTAAASLSVDALGQVFNMDAESRAIAESMAEERLIAESKRTAQTAEATSESWMEAFVNSEDAELRTAVAQAEDAFRHLTGQRSGMEVANKVQDLWRASGVKTNTLGKNVAPLTRDSVDDSDENIEKLFQTMDEDQNGKITWHEAYKFYEKQRDEDMRDDIAFLAEASVSRNASEEAKANVAETFQDGLAGELAALDKAVDKALKPKEDSKPTALLEKKAEEKHEKDLSILDAELAQYEAEEQRKSEEKSNREKRWAKILERQQESLLQQEQDLKAKEKELHDLEREESWQQEQQQKKELALLQKFAAEQEQVKDVLEDQVKVVAREQEKTCAGGSVQALISASEDHSHASCLKGQIGSCVSTEVLQAPSEEHFKCDEPSDGWQKKCLADKAQEMADCAPMGVDWHAMRRGEKGHAADNAALGRLAEWCTMHRALGKIDKDKAPFSLILSKNAALSKDAVAKLADFGENFKGQDWDLLQVDPVGNPAPLHSVVVKSQSATKIKDAMSLMKAVPLDQVPKALNADPKYETKAVAWNAGVAGMLEKTSIDCSLESPLLLKKDTHSNSLLAGFR